ncbi:hypothetical protein NBRC111894_3345 [Sporolactobacillus inulinus]|uniref:Uncharacterized protein n=1 Tax=Sporolactobacillus inulinus TaxID=2078 RepID=A0A4Y1ZFQ5_9BACL|nr:hypothetical protein NBRC111894_3345 [Sporolactobacillus inulinus]
MLIIKEKSAEAPAGILAILAWQTLSSTQTQLILFLFSTFDRSRL